LKAGPLTNSKGQVIYQTVTRV